MIVKLVNLFSEEEKDEIESLSIGKDYEVLEMAGPFYRIISDSDKEPYLYPNDCFEIVDDTKPEFWVTEEVDEEIYSGPPNWQVVGFWDNYFDDIKQVKQQFKKDYKNNS